MSGLLTPIATAAAPIIGGVAGVVEGVGAEGQVVSPIVKSAIKLFELRDIVGGKTAQEHAHKANAQAIRIDAAHKRSSHRIDAIRAMGQTRAAFGASGLEMSGSVMDALVEQAGELAREGYRAGLGLDQYAHAIMAKQYKASARSTLLGGLVEIGGGLALETPKMKKALERMGKGKRSSPGFNPVGTNLKTRIL